MTRMLYLLKEAFINIRLNQTTTVVAVLTTAFTMMCFGIFLLVYYNVRGVTTTLQDDIKVVVYLDDGLSADRLAALQASLTAQREVASLDYLSKEDALRDFYEQFPAETTLLQGLGENPLPASMLVTMAAAFRSSESVKRWAEKVQLMPGVAQVQYNRDWIEHVSRVVRYIEWSAVAIGGLLAAAAVTIIGSTIRLTLYARRDEIDIMRLIGATGMFIRVPYLVEGAILGALGSALSLSLLKAAFEFFRLQFGGQGRFLGGAISFTFFPGRMSLVIIAAGLLLGSLGSLMSLRAFERGKA